MRDSHVAKGSHTDLCALIQELAGHNVTLVAWTAPRPPHATAAPQSTPLIAPNVNLSAGLPRPPEQAERRRAGGLPPHAAILWVLRGVRGLRELGAPLQLDPSPGQF